MADQNSRWNAPPLPVIDALRDARLLIYPEQTGESCIAASGCDEAGGFGWFHGGAY